MTTMFDTILLATDGSDAADEAIDTAIHLANVSDAAIHALYVIDRRFVADDYDPVVEKAEGDAEVALDRVKDRADPLGIDVTLHLRRGLPHEQILGAIEDYGADVVVLGATGRTGLDRFFGLGSVAERVIQHSPVHVLVAPAPEQPECQ